RQVRAAAQGSRGAWQVSARGLLAKTDEELQRVELLVICACLAAILVAVSANVISRSFSLLWPDASEVALMSMAALTFIGSAYAVARRAHITIDLGEMISSSLRLKRGLAVATELLIAAVSLLFIVYGGDLLAYVVRMDERSAGLE